MNSDPTSPSAPARPAPGDRRPLLVGGLVVLDLLVAALLEATGHGGSALGLAPAGGPIAAALLAPGFLVLGAVEIAALAVVRGTLLDRLFGPLLLGQVALLVLTPSLFAAGPPATIALVLGAAATTAIFVLSLAYLHRHKQLDGTRSEYLLAWAVAATVTGAGWAVWAIDGTALLLPLGVLLQLTLGLFVAVGGLPSDDAERVPWLLRPFWVFRLLLATFLAEFFFGALLDYAIAGPTFLQYIPFVAIPAAGPAAIAPAVYDGLWFASAILASAWFLILLGFTMGTLVLMRWRETHEPGQRYRMAITVAFFGLAAVYLPSFASSTPITTDPAIANLPVVGWGFGLRAGGPFESGVFLAVIVMYAFVGVATVLFGRKALCSVMCGAAVLYQAAPVHDMRRFNQTSRVGRYFLGSQLTTAYSVASGLALVSLFGVSLLGLLHRLPAVPVANGQLDVAALPLPIELYFGGLWFVMFVATPYLGTYNCATTGFCHWGALSLPFARVGLYRLKVKDKTVCQRCTTFDCAKACSVGLVDMPQYFRTVGEYRSAKCCGVGDCVGACPYGNLYEHDVRIWLRRRLGRRTPESPGVPLPMLPNRPREAPPVATAPRAGAP